MWILGLKPASGGSLKAARPVGGAGGGGGAAGAGSGADTAVLTTAVLADLPVLSSMLSRLFESSRYLDEVALHHLIDALNQLNHESMELAFSNRVRRGAERRRAVVHYGGAGPENGRKEGGGWF